MARKIAAVSSGRHTGARCSIGCAFPCSIRTADSETSSDRDRDKADRPQDCQPETEPYDGLVICWAAEIEEQAETRGDREYDREAVEETVLGRLRFALFVTPIPVRHLSPQEYGSVVGAASALLLLFHSLEHEHDMGRVLGVEVFRTRSEERRVGKGCRL